MFREMSSRKEERVAVASMVLTVLPLCSTSSFGQDVLKVKPFQIWRKEVAMFVGT
jgi:hypothetical protein